MLWCGVLSFVQDDETVIQRSTTHERKWRYFNNLFLKISLCSFCANHVVQCVIERTQIRINLCGEVTRQETETLACFYSGARKDNSLDTFRVKCQHGHRDSKPALTCTSRTNAKGNDVVSNGFNIFALTRRFRANVFTATGAQNVFSQNQTWFLICLHHHD